MPSRVAIARAIAVGADALQLGLFPVFCPGLASPLNVALDTAVCVVLTWLVGWHVAFMPSFLVEEVPFLNLAPTWTLAILIKTRQKSAASTQPPPSPASTPPDEGPVIDVETVRSIEKPIPAPPVLTTRPSAPPILNVGSTPANPPAS